MSGLEKLGLEWDSLLFQSSSALTTQYLDLLNSAATTTHVRTHRSYDANNSFTHTSQREQSRELASILWTLGRMKFDINNQTHTLLINTHTNHELMVNPYNQRTMKLPTTITTTTTTVPCLSKSMKEKILEKVVQVFLIDNRLLGQTVSMILKGLSKIGYTCQDFTSTSIDLDKESNILTITFVLENENMTSVRVLKTAEVESVVALSIMRGGPSHAHTLAIDTENCHRCKLSDIMFTTFLSESTELSPSELVTVLQALAFMQVSE
jgi:hypothetical protein